MAEIAIIGAGAWGTALSIVLGRKGSHHVRLWVHEPELGRAMREGRMNEAFLSGREIPASVQPTHSAEQALCDAELVVWVTPSEYCRATLHSMRNYIPRQALIVSATKGIENESLL